MRAIPRQIIGHELVFGQLQLCGPQVPPLRGILPDGLPSQQPQPGLVQRSEARRRQQVPAAADRGALPSGLPGAALLLMSGLKAAPGPRTAQHPGPRPPLRAWDPEPAVAAAALLQPNPPVAPEPPWQGAGGLRLDEEGACHHA